MAACPRPTLWTALGAWWRATLAAAWVGGTALQLQQPALWPARRYGALQLGAALILVLAAAFWAWRPLCARLLAAASVAGAAFALAGLHAQVRLADALDPRLEGKDLWVEGVVVGLPRVSDEGTQFLFRVQSARRADGADPVGRARSRSRARPGSAAPLGGAVSSPSQSPLPASTSVWVSASAVPVPVPVTVTVTAPVPVPVPDAETDVRGIPSTLWLAWYTPAPTGAPERSEPRPSVQAGERWRLPVRLKQPHGAMNPSGFDHELWLFEQGVRATGSVRAGGACVGRDLSPILAARQAVRDRLRAWGRQPGVDERIAGTLAALTVGDQAAIDSASWDMFRATGVAHLMSISGVHVTMLGWLAGRLLSAVWRRSPRAMHRWPASVAGRWAGVVGAALYAAFAGWGVPAQRTLAMLACAVWLRGRGLDWPPLLLTVATMVPVTALDPWALLQPGFWLSFAAVALLVLAEPDAPAQAGHAPGAAHPLPGRPHRALLSRLRAAVRLQLRACVCLAPLTLLMFRQVSPVGLLANLVAEPWVTLVVTPLALAGVWLPPCRDLAAGLLQPLFAFLEWLAGWPGASWQVAAPPAWAAVAGLAGAAWLALPLPLPAPARALGGLLALPLLAPPVARPDAGRFELVAADVGQGSAVLVRTHGHLLLFDTGPRFGAASDAGRRLLVPLLQARGERRIDRLVLSHADADHIGGAAAIARAFPVADLRSPMSPGDPRLPPGSPHRPCASGERWTWDGVRFEFLHPDPVPSPPDRSHGNARSCVLQVTDAQGHRALLAGDIEAAQERGLVARFGAALRSDVLLVPHHGSRTSSTPTFVTSVQPRVAIIQAGYRNGYGHPAPEVLARYRAVGVEVVRSDRCGAWTWTGTESNCTRMVRGRYWHARFPPQDGVPEGCQGAACSAMAGSDVANE